MPLYGFGNHHQSEAYPGALPIFQNSPQHLNHGLFAEQINASAFTRSRKNNLHSWLYRTQPSAARPDFTYCHSTLISPTAHHLPPIPLRWSALPATGGLSFLEGLQHVAGNPAANIFIFHTYPSEQKNYLTSYDGEWLFLPYEGQATLHTEFGLLSLIPGEIAVIPRGTLFRIEAHTPWFGYLCENKGLPFGLPQLGLIGANGLANPRHFIYPDAAYETDEKTATLFCKYQDHLFQVKLPRSPLNVVAWHGNLAPYKYDLRCFNTINSVSFDHPDPSLFTVLTSPSEHSDIANLDLVIFPSRWLVAEHTFRPPYFHRNVMSELMGLIYGEYDAKKTGFEPGGISIHNAYVPHGPDSQTYQTAIREQLKPKYLEHTLAFMLESQHVWQVTDMALQHPSRQKNYTDCWQSMPAPESL